MCHLCKSIVSTRQSNGLASQSSSAQAVGMPRNGVPLMQPGMAGEPTIVSALEWVRADAVHELSEPELTVLKNVFAASGIEQWHHLEGIELADLAAPQGTVLTAPLKALLRKSVARVSASGDVVRPITSKRALHLFAVVRRRRRGLPAAKRQAVRRILQRLCSRWCAS